MTQAAILAASGSPGTTTGFKNRIINGSMTIDQRNAGASWSATNGGYSLDRWYALSFTGGATTGKYTIQQNAGSVTPPVGFTNYLGVTASTATSTSASDIYGISQPIEGYNIADLGWGTANAKTVTLSFWVRSSATGTFGGALKGGQYYPFTYTISSANTWEQKSITIAGSTSGTWQSTSSSGVEVSFGLQVGSTYSGTAGSWSSSLAYGATGCVNLLNNSGATWYVTGVQLEVGTTATNFDFRSIGTELALCQRYYQQITGVTAYNVPVCYGFANTASNFTAGLKPSTSFRATPTISGSSGVQVSDANSYTVNYTSISVNTGSTEFLQIAVGTSGGQTVFRPSYAQLSNVTTAYVGLSAEL